jgi:hypothetical protein
MVARVVVLTHGDVNDGATSHANGVCAGQHYHVGQGHFPLRRCALDALHGLLTDYQQKLLCAGFCISLRVCACVCS